MYLGPWTLTVDEIRGPEPLYPFGPVSEPLPFLHLVTGQIYTEYLLWPRGYAWWWMLRLTSTVINQADKLCSAHMEAHSS